MLFPNITQAVKTKIKEFDDARLNILRKRKFLWILFITTSLIIAFVTWNTEVFQWLFAIPVVGIGTYGYYSWIKSDLTKKFKIEVFTKQMDVVEKISYHADQHISLDDFLSSGIYNNRRVDRYHGEDFFEGKMDKTSYKFSEIKAEEKHTSTNSKGQTQTHWVTIFDGIMMIADFNKHIKTETRVIQRNDGFFEKMSNKDTKVIMESVEFEKMFNTYSSDQVEARYILSPAMMERIMKLQKVFKSKIHLSFKGNRVYIAIANNFNYFEANLTKEINENQINRIFREIDFCLNIINILDLNTRIWTKK